MDLLSKPYTPEETRNKLMNILVGIEHRSFSQSLLADVVDTIPVIGDVSNAIRMTRETDKIKHERQKFDFLAGSAPPPFGEIFDIITPTNTMNYCLLPPPLPPIRKFKNRRL